MISPPLRSFHRLAPVLLGLLLPPTAAANDTAFGGLAARPYPIRSEAVQRFFNARWWYRPDPRFAGSRLDERDWAAVKRIKARLQRIRVKSR